MQQKGQIIRILLSGNRSQQIDKLRKAAQEDGCFFIGESPFTQASQIRKKCLD